MFEELSGTRGKHYVQYAGIQYSPNILKTSSLTCNQLI
jgi:hypothetical protein